MMMKLWGMVRRMSAKVSELIKLFSNRWRAGRYTKCVNSILFSENYLGGSRPVDFPAKFHALTPVWSRPLASLLSPGAECRVSLRVSECQFPSFWPVMRAISRSTFRAWKQKAIWPSETYDKREARLELHQERTRSFEINFYENYAHIAMRLKSKMKHRNVLWWWKNKIARIFIK